MMHSKIATTLVALFGAALVNAGSNPDPVWIAKRVAEIKKAETPASARIPWVATLLDARQISQQERRPVFLFSYEGRLDTGRC